MNFSNISSDSLSATRSSTPKRFSLFEDTWSGQVAQSQNLDKQAYENTISGLKTDIERKDLEIAELRLNNEILVAAMYQTNTPMQTPEPDAVEISHRILNRLTKLRTENEMLTAKATGSYNALLEVEVDTLRRELAQYKKI